MAILLGNLHFAITNLFAVWQQMQRSREGEKEKDPCHNYVTRDSREIIMPWIIYRLKEP